MHTLLPHTLFSFIWYFLRPYKYAAFLFIVFAVLSGFWGPLNSLLIKKVINLLPEAKTNDSILFLPATMITVNFIILGNLTWRGIGYINKKYQGVIKNQIIRSTLAHLLDRSHQFFQDNMSGRITSQIITLADNIERIVHRISLDFIRGSSVLIISLITTLNVNMIFFYILILWFICFTTFSYLMSRRLINFADQHARSEAKLSGQLVDVLMNQSNVRAFARSALELERMDGFLRTVLAAFRAKENFVLMLCAMQGITIAVMIAFATYFLIHLYCLDLVSAGDFALILGIVIEVGYITWHTMSRIDDFNQAYGKCKQSLTSLIDSCASKNLDVDKELMCINGQIIFSNVKFHYKGEEPLFQNKSIGIKAGQKVGLVGYSGSGKSTFANLILGLYEINDGAILIDEQDIRRVTSESLRLAINMIPQDPVLFHRSLMENIRCGKKDASDEEVIQAAKKAHAHEFITKLPNAYNSLVGERGVKLSGGQRQRIAIARAILKNAPILILDEATSQLDSLTENLIQDSLWDLMQGKTTLVIAHRLSTLLHMDRILVFDRGKIVGDGSHAKLLVGCALYKNLWDAQVGGFLMD
ncbi:putative ABC transporter ATP-binding protein [Rickettsiales endosymbiont of Paramecium tredecaurelia]|uniref:ABC transporter ATP-binding protein n=1 Tax=Candidatus Sarmatiella mevalonica TaxID=2770581 RepID=UPI001923956B|nr:ABC transporter ATP-binding protein [Candidatus Sarmatiella mevalonica]MBL3284485.1 putative ABC transporter ATP-binding protein [Candidatus Sarmatiella mevalonica]